MAHTALQVLAKLRDAFLALDEFAEAGGFDELNKTAPAAAKKTAAKKPAPAPEPDEDDDATDTELPSEDELKVMGIKELRALAVALNLEEQKTKAGILAEIESMRDDEDDADEDYEDEDEAEDEDYEDDTDDENGDDESEDEADEDDEDADEDDDAYTREELEELDLKTLRSIAKSEGVPVAEYRSADKDKLVDLILGMDEDDEGDDDPEADEDDAEGELTEEDIKKMTVAQLTELAAELEITIPRRVNTNKDQKAKKAALVQLIMDTAEDE